MKDNFIIFVTRRKLKLKDTSFSAFQNVKRYQKHFWAMKAAFLCSEKREEAVRRMCILEEVIETSPINLTILINLLLAEKRDFL